MIDVQRSRWNDAERQSFTLNCGVYVPGVLSTFSNGTNPKHPKLPDCCISSRVGKLRSRYDIWWEVAAADPVEKDSRIREEIASLAIETALPFLERFETERQVAQFLSEKRAKEDEHLYPYAASMSLAYAAIIWRKLGDADKCSACIEEAKREAKKTPQGAFVAAFADRWRC